ncbi:MAG: cysteine desulfurase [Candidatus Cloacimonetes bacterium]|nr:cysteine desulfurase [Candidatus Cloacimonadota bacterium]
MKPIYMNNCITSQPAPEVVDAMLPYLREKFQFPENFIKTGTERANELSIFKEIIAESINAQPAGLHFTSSGTEANNLAIKGYLSANAHRGNHIICSVVDYPDILTNAAYFEESGFEVTYLRCDEYAFIDLDELQEELRADTILVMTTLANHTVGTLQDVKTISQLIRDSASEAALFVDACQAYGRYAIDVEEMGIDMMSISAHKIHGPQGIGALYIRSGISIAPTKHGVNRIDPLSTGGLSIANIAGFAKAVELAFSDFDENVKYIRELSRYLCESIERKIPYTMLNGAPCEYRVAHNVNISFDFIEGEAIMMMLDQYDINVATGSACFSEGLQANYIMMAMGRNHEQSHSSMKFTLSRYNTRAEVDYVVEKLTEIVAELRRRSPLYLDFLEKNK